MTRNVKPTRGDGNRGRWLVIALIALAVILGIVGLSLSRWVRPRAEPEVPAQDAAAQDASALDAPALDVPSQDAPAQDAPAVTAPQPAP